jgi:hypothetical protein
MPVDQNVTDFQPLDSKTAYVRGSDEKLWRETGSSASRTLVDHQVAAFQPVDARIVYIASTDGKLWRETGDMHTRKLIAGAQLAFQYVPDGDTTYALRCV